jgi:DNA-directed RNA polymerase subunit RPC12/RpoP
MPETLETLSLSCNHCGATLDVPEETRFVTCTYCDTKLEVARKGGAAFTRVKEAVERLEEHAERAEERAEKLERDVEVLRLEQAIERVDREWERERETLMDRSKNGTLSVPDKTVGWFIAAAVIGMGMILGYQSSMWLAVALVIGGIALGLFHAAKADRYQQAFHEYQDRHAELAEKLDEARDRS